MSKEKLQTAEGLVQTVEGLVETVETAETAETAETVETVEVVETVTVSMASKEVTADEEAHKPGDALGVTVEELPPHVDVKPDKVVLKKEPSGEKVGYVVNCNSLRLREGANIRTKPMAIIPVGTKIKVNLDNSTESFYEVKFNELIGFCVKEFIKVV